MWLDPAACQLNQLLLAYKALNGLGAKYSSDLLLRYEPPRPSGCPEQVCFLSPSRN